ncbi:MAG: hypothetical protein JF630_17900, partial [Geodermatophilales bacterium]|nr:hypothetical protein [Geodermatophilales bacterium]
DGAAAPTSPAPSTGGPAPEDGAKPGVGAGAGILADALDVVPRTDLAWAAGRSLLPATLATLQDGGVRHVVLDSGALTEGNTAVGLKGSSTSPHTTVSTPSGRVDALVADATLGEVVGSAERTPGGPRMAEQRYLAELAVLDLQAPAGTDQAVLVAPPREIEAGPDGAGAMMADTAGLPWLRPGAVEGAEAAPASPAGDLVTPAEAGAGTRLDPAGMADVTASESIRNDLAGAVVGVAGTALREYDAATARAVSVDWRSDPRGFRNVAQDLRTAMKRLRDTRGLSIGDIGPQILAPGERTTLQVPTRVQQSGGFAVTAGLTTPGGGPLGDRVQMQVKSAAYGPISLIITIGAAALLGLLFLRRLVRFVLRRRRAAADVPVGAPEGAAVPLPPTRSPV